MTNNVKNWVKTVSSFFSPFVKLNNHPDEVDLKVVTAYGLVNKATIHTSWVHDLLKLIGINLPSKKKNPDLTIEINDGLVTMKSYQKPVNLLMHHADFCPWPEHDKRYDN